MEKEKIAIIPARGGSKRIPKKNIKEFCGRPIICYAIEAALQSKLFDEVMVSTDSEEIAEIARKYGASVPFMRSREAAGDYASTAQVIFEVLDEYEKKGDCIWIAKSAEVFESAYINGPCIIGKEAQVRHCAFIRGNAIVGEGAVVGNSTELKNVILFNKVQVPHYNYVGDSILGYKAHMGAGSITSNVKSDKKLIVIKGADESIETGLKKIGAFLGDEVEIGCGSVLNPGTIIGKKSNIYPLSSVRGFVQAGSIYKKQGEIVKKLD